MMMIGMTSSTCSVLSASFIAVCIIFMLQQHREMQEVRKDVLEFKKEMILLQESTKRRCEDILPSVASTLDITPNYHHDMDGGSDSTKRYLEVQGLVGDGVADDYRAIQRAINQATRGRRDGTVILPKGTFLITKTLKIKGGVTLVGQGYGPSPLAMDHSKGGTTLAHCGTNYALRITGHSATVENLGITDFDYGSTECVNKQSQGGLLLHANATGIESFTMRNVLIYKFMSGTAITLQAENAGGIAYASFENIRIRHAKKGIHLKADSTSFVNSNNFHDGAISGAITDVAVFAEGPGACNDNKFNGMVIEPPETGTAHVHVKGAKTNVRMNNMRLEGSNMSADKPLVIIEDDSYGNAMNGMLGHTNILVDFNRNPDVTFKSGKTLALQPPPYNLIWNAAFNGLNSTSNTLPGWSVDGTSVALSIVPGTTQSPILYANHNILQVTHNVGTIKIKPIDIPPSPIHSFVSFGVYAQSTVKGSISSAMKYESGNTIASSSHSGTGKWEFIGMSAKYDKSNGHQAYFSITGDVKLSAPTFVYGSAPASPGSEFLSSSGGRMAGVLSFHAVDVEPQTGDRWVLPLEGNIFLIQPFASSGGGTGCADSYNDVRRINDSSSVRFAKGSVITIVFPSCGGCIPCLGVIDNAYISLLGGNDFKPSSSLSSGASLTIMSNGSGSWREISRNGS